MRYEHTNRDERKVDSDLNVRRMKVRNRERSQVGSIADRSSHERLSYPTGPLTEDRTNVTDTSVEKKNQLDVSFCILYFSSNSCSTCFEQPCANHQQLTTA